MWPRDHKVNEYHITLSSSVGTLHFPTFSHYCIKLVTNPPRHSVTAVYYNFYYYGIVAKSDDRFHLVRIHPFQSLHEKEDTFFPSGLLRFFPLTFLSTRRNKKRSSRTRSHKSVTTRGEEIINLRSLRIRGRRRS